MHAIGEIPLFLLNPIQSFLATQQIYTAFCFVQPLPIEEGGAAISGQSTLRPQAWSQDCEMWSHPSPSDVILVEENGYFINKFINMIYEYDIYI